MNLRRFLVFLMTVGIHSLALPQSYQSSFSEVRFDRAKGSATLNAGLQVDAATGAASMSMPFGPGIGERGLKFRPVMSMRIAPQMAISTTDENQVLFQMSSGYNYTVQAAVDNLYQKSWGSASFSPGTLDLGTIVSTMDRKQTTYSLPDGSGGRALGQVPSSLTATHVAGMLTAFGYGSTATVGYFPGNTSVPVASRTSFIQMGSTGHLIIGLRASGLSDPTYGITDEVIDDIQDNPASTYRWHFPRRVLVIQGDVAYEFKYVDHTYMTRTIPYLAISQKTQLYSGHYLLNRILNRFGESILFSYDSNGIGYTATWNTAGTTNPPSIRVQLIGPTNVAAGQTTLMNHQVGVTSASQIRISYQNISTQLPSYLLTVTDPITGVAFTPATLGGPSSSAAGLQSGQRAYDFVHFDSANLSIQPLSILEEASVQQIGFTWGTGPTATWAGQSVTPTVLSSYSLSNRTISLNWQVNPFRSNYSPDSWTGITASSFPGRPTYFYGVTAILDSDGTQVRATSHQRTFPTSNWITAPMLGAPLDQWVTTAFYDVITNPNGTIEVHRFVEPPTTNALAGSSGIQNLAFIKTLEREVRYYLPGADWSADTGVTSPASSSAYKWVVKDRFDVRSIGAPDGSLYSQAVPYPTRVRTWDKESQVLTVEETVDWDSTTYGWKTVHKTTSIDASPSLTPDYASLAQQVSSYSAYAATLGTYRRVDRTFNTSISDWFIARPATEKITLVQDNTGFLAPGVSLPDAQPQVSRTYNASVNRVDSVAVAGSDNTTVTTAFGYQSTTGIQAVELLNAFLSSPGLVLSGQLGVSVYGYDSLGHLNSIGQKPNSSRTITVQQASDEVGRPISQTDPNGVVRSISWDSAGRLSGISSSDGDVATSISYNDSDHRGVTVTRGAQVTTYRYNGFGELILERRLSPDGSWSHKVYGFDLVGRPTGDTVWMPGDGSNHEADWIKPNLTQEVKTTVTTPTTTICKRWGFDEDGNAICVSWQTIPGGTTTTVTSAAYSGTVIAYDGRGRTILQQDANGVVTRQAYHGPESLPPGVTAYIGPIRTVTHGADQVKWFESDSFGRLARVTTPVTRNDTVTNPRTEYRYDGGGRISEVKQFDEVGRTQTRSWSYNRLGWLTGLTQPESGTTAYSGFTVAGKPTITNYNGRVVRSTPDWMGRTTGISADDGTVSQTFIFDTATGGVGKLASSSDGSTTTTYGYGAQGNRLGSLFTTAIVQGSSQSFTQSFSYDTYGNRTSGNTSHATWGQTFHLPAGLPSLLSLGTTTVASTPWSSYDPTSWALQQVSYGNGTGSQFAYDTDQNRIKGITHGPSSGAPYAQWSYVYDSGVNGSGGNGNLLRDYNVLTGSFDQYGYDQMGRLISALVESPTYGDQLQTFDYDAFGNRLSGTTYTAVSWVNGARGSTGATATTTASNVPTVANMTFNAGDSALVQRNQLPSATSSGALTGAIYDAQGNLTQVFERGDSSKIITMAYDAFGRVTSLYSSRTGITETYRYTAEGLRTVIQESVSGSLQKTRVNLYNDQRQLVAQYEKTLTGLLTWKRDIVYLGTREVAEFDSGGMHVVMADRTGTPRLLVSQTRSIESQQKYLPYGEVLEQSGLLKTAKGYTNHEQTDSSGLIYMQARFYLPWVGRFGSPDPARDQHFEDTQSWNIYSYVRNNPVMGADPTGMLADQLNASQNMGIAGTMSGSGDYSTFWQDDVNSMAADAAVDQGKQEAQNNFAQTGNFLVGAGVGIGAQSASIADIASSKVGSTDYLQSQASGKYPAGANKCNKLPADTIEASGLPRPQVSKTGIIGWIEGLFGGGKRDPTAHEWADPKISIPGWSSPMPVSGARAGDVIAQQHGDWGHVGVVVAPGQTVSVNSAVNPTGSVTRNDWGFRSAPYNGESSRDPAPVIRRYLGGD